MNKPTCFIVWNSRDANGDNFFKKIINNHNPCLVALLETKMESHLSIKNYFGFDDYLEVPCW